MAADAAGDRDRDQEAVGVPWWVSVDLDGLGEERIRDGLAWSSVLTNVLMLVPGDTVDGVKVDSVRFAESRQRPGCVLLIVEGVKGKKRYASYSVANTAPEAAWSWHTRKAELRLSWREIAARAAENAADGSSTAPPLVRPE